MMNEYEKFLSSKQHEISNHGFEPVLVARSICRLSSGVRQSELS